MVTIIVTTIWSTEKTAIYECYITFSSRRGGDSGKKKIKTVYIHFTRSEQNKYLENMQFCKRKIFKAPPSRINSRSV